MPLIHSNLPGGRPINGDGEPQEQGAQQPSPQHAQDSPPQQSPQQDERAPQPNTPFNSPHTDVTHPSPLRSHPPMDPGSPPAYTPYHPDQTRQGPPRMTIPRRPVPAPAAPSTRPVPRLTNGQGPQPHQTNGVDHRQRAPNGVPVRQRAVFDIWDSPEEGSEGSDTTAAEEDSELYQGGPVARGPHERGPDEPSAQAAYARYEAYASRLVESDSEGATAVDSDEERAQEAEEEATRPAGSESEGGDETQGTVAEAEAGDEQTDESSDLSSVMLPSDDEAREGEMREGAAAGEHGGMATEGAEDMVGAEEGKGVAEPAEEQGGEEEGEEEEEGDEEDDEPAANGPAGSNQSRDGPGPGSGGTGPSSGQGGGMSGPASRRSARRAGRPRQRPSQAEGGAGASTTTPTPNQDLEAPEEVVLSLYKDIGFQYHRQRWDHRMQFLPEYWGQQKLFEDYVNKVESYEVFKALFSMQESINTNFLELTSHPTPEHLWRVKRRLEYVDSHCDICGFWLNDSLFAVEELMAYVRRCRAVGKDESTVVDDHRSSWMQKIAVLEFYEESAKEDIVSAGGGVDH